MGLPVSEQIRWWGLALLVIILLLWQVSGVLLPFIAGAALAYFLDPVADRLEARGFSRTLSVVLISVVALAIVVLMFVLAIPTMLRQIQAFFDLAPELFRSFRDFIAVRFPNQIVEGGIIHEALSSFGEKLREQGGALAGRILESSLAFVDFLILLIVTPVVTFYLLLDWDDMVAVIDSWLPREHAPVIRDLMGRIDRVLAGFVRGQLTVCAILGSFYGMALMFIGLPFGLMVGVFAGLISFIPFVGSIFGGSLAIGLALFEFWDNPVWIAVTAGIFVLGQAVEGNFLTPKLVGGSVGLHPVWLMLALSVFGALMGFTGMLIAVPVTASIGVLSRFFLDQYLAGRLYNGPEEPESLNGENLDQAQKND